VFIDHILCTQVKQLISSLQFALLLKKFIQADFGQASSLSGLISGEW
jgi:hypothetical protein